MGSVRLPMIRGISLDSASEVIDLIDAVQGRIHVVAIGNISADAFYSDIIEVRKLTTAECPDPYLFVRFLK